MKHKKYNDPFAAMKGAAIGTLGVDASRHSKHDSRVCNNFWLHASCFDCGHWQVIVKDAEKEIVFL